MSADFGGRAKILRSGARIGVMGGQFGGVFRGCPAQFRRRLPSNQRLPDRFVQWRRGLGWPPVRKPPSAAPNFAAPIYHRLIAAFERGDLAAARKEQLRSVELIRLLVRYGFMGAAKATMSFLEVNVGPARLPNRTLSPNQKTKLRADLEQLGFFDWIKPSTV